VIGGARLQCAQYSAAIDELVARKILEAGSPVELLYGDGAAVLRHLRVAQAFEQPKEAADKCQPDGMSHRRLTAV
jgi:hypothetical protein